MITEKFDTIVFDLGGVLMTHNMPRPHGTRKYEQGIRSGK